MGLVIGKSEEFERELIKQGQHKFVCAQVIDIGTQKITWEGKTKEQKKVILVFEFPEILADFDGEMLPRVKSKTYTQSFHEKASLRKDLESWRGKKFTEAEIESFDLFALVGKAGEVFIKHDLGKDEKKYDNLESFLECEDDADYETVIPQIKYEFGQPIPENMMEWVGKKITESVDYKA